LLANRRKARTLQLVALCVGIELFPFAQLDHRLQPDRGEPLLAHEALQAVVVNLDAEFGETRVFVGCSPDRDRRRLHARYGGALGRRLLEQDRLVLNHALHHRREVLLQRSPLDVVF
jgi:hypothetical protein